MSESINWKDLKQVAEDATKPLPDGDYPVTVTKADLKKASTGSDMVAVQLTVTAGDRAGRIIFNNFVFSPEKPFALKMWFDNLAAFGLDDSFFGMGPSLEHVAAALLNKSAIVTTKIREWNGRQMNDCSGFKSAGGAMGAIVGLPTVGATAAASGSAPPVPAVSSSLPPIPQAGGNSSTPPQPNF
jgi:hypothetical protein